NCRRSRPPPDTTRSDGCTRFLLGLGMSRCPAGSEGVRSLPRMTRLRPPRGAFAQDARDDHTPAKRAGTGMFRPGGRACRGLPRPARQRDADASTGGMRTLMSSQAVPVCIIRVCPVDLYRGLDDLRDMPWVTI